MMRKIIALVCLIALQLATGTAHAQNSPSFREHIIPGLAHRESELRAGLLYDVSNHTIVWQKDMNYAYPIASLTKMMVALLAVEDIKAEKRDWSDEIVVTRSYRKSPRSRKVIVTKQTYTLESLVQSAMIPSNNDACSDIGRHLNGSVEAFVLRMNQRAAELGMTQTFFSNPSGLPGLVSEIDNSSSPKDLLKLCLELLKHDEMLRITSIGYAEISNGKTKGVHRNHNRLVIDYDDHVDGLKTGYTRRAGFCLAATAKIEDSRLVCIVLGVATSTVRNEIVATMLNNYYATMGCGRMKPSFKEPERVVAQNDSGVVYKTVWTKQRQTHKVKSGESLTVIARKYKVTFQQLKKWNHLKNDRIHPGQQIAVYVNVKKKIAIKPEPKNEEEKEDDHDERDIQIQAGTTTDSTKAAALKEVAQNPAPTKKVEPASTPQKKVEPKVKYVYHTVQPGDTLWSIARKYRGVSAEDIKKTNKLPNPNVIQPGTKLKIKLG
ncbi:MAG: LysM peptidoglycan-binding domain-containing protein [Bacteroidota bacterium]